MHRSPAHLSSAGLAACLWLLPGIATWAHSKSADFQVTLTVASTCVTTTANAADPHRRVSVRCEPETPYVISWDAAGAPPDARVAGQAAPGDVEHRADGIVTVTY